MRSTLAIVVLFLLGSSVSAQSPIYNPAMTSPFSRPTLSPYLNLLRGGDPAANYFMGVLPEYNLRATSVLADYAYRMSVLQPSLGTGDSNQNLFGDEEQLSPTGHPAAFMYYNGAYAIPNVRSFIPFNSGQGGQRAPLRR